MSIPRLTIPLMPQLSALQDLIAAEELDSGKRVRMGNKVNWFSDVFRMGGSTVKSIWKPVLVVALWSSVVAVCNFVYGQDLKLGNNVLPLLSVVVGLLLVFRNQTAFARWDEGRKSFTSLVSTARSLARHFWISIGAPVPQTRVNSQGITVAHLQHDTQEPDGELPEEEVRKKARACRLLVAFVVAVKRHVRQQYGVDYEDLKALLPAGFYSTVETPGFGFSAADADMNRSPTSYAGKLQQQNQIPAMNLPDAMTAPNGAPAAAAPNGTLALRPGGEGVTVQAVGAPAAGIRKRASLQTSETQGLDTDESAPLLGWQPNRFGGRREVSEYRREDDAAVIVHNYLSKPNLPLPLVITHQIHLYLARCKAHGLLESVGPAGYNALVMGLATMTEQFSQIEKLSQFFIPSCYGIHLKQCTTLYLTALPLTLLELDWKLIPFCTIVAFTLMGIEALARECEDPFGTDPSDLPLDMLAAELRNEVEHLIARLGTSSRDLMI